MRLPRALTSLVLAAGLAGCAGGSSGSLGPLADQADRVATLVEQGEPCLAMEAVRSLQRMADGDVDPAVRDAVTQFATSARQGLVCDADAASEPPSTAPPSRPAADEGDDGQAEAPDGPEASEGPGREQAPGQQDKDKDKDEDEDEDEGRGNGNGNGNGEGEGQGNRGRGSGEGEGGGDD